MRSCLFFFALLCAATAFAQPVRNVDIALKLVTPANGEILTPGAPFEFNIQAKNAAGQALLPSDTIKVRWYYDGATVPFTNPATNTSDTFLRLGGFSIAPGDSLIIFTRQIIISDSGVHDFCFEASLVAAAATPGITDPNLSNNRSCARVNLSPVGIASVVPAAAAFEVYPVPARGTLYWKSGFFQPHTIALYNITGVCVQRSTLNGANPALDISALPAGIYQLLATNKKGETVRRQIVVE